MNEIFAANFITYAPDSWMEASEYASEAINRVKTTTIPDATPFAAVPLTADAVVPPRE